MNTMMHRTIHHHRSGGRPTLTWRHVAPLVIILLLVVLLIGCGDDTADRNFTDADAGAEILLDRGDRFTLRLESNPTTGYAWSLDEASLPSGVELVSATYEADDTDGDRVGAGGTEVFVFEATAPDAGVIRLEYVRSFEDDPVPARLVEYTVTVDGAR